MEVITLGGALSIVGHGEFTEFDASLQLFCWQQQYQCEWQRAIQELSEKMPSAILVFCRLRMVFSNVKLVYKISEMDSIFKFCSKGIHRNQIPASMLVVK